MRDFLGRLRSAWFGALLVVTLVSSALAGPPSFVVFGDSLSDPGNAFALLGTASAPPFQSFIPSAPYDRGGHDFSNGSTWVEQLSSGISAPPAGPAFGNPGVFFNYAVGGARARLAGPFDLTGQVSRYLSDVAGRGSPDALYVVWIGGDDLRDAVQALAVDPTGTQSKLILQQALGVLQNDLFLLYGAGARNFLVVNAPDLGLVPEARMQGPLVQFFASLFSQQFNAGLAQVLGGLQAAPGVTLTKLDTYELLHEVVGAPSLFGFSNVTTPCIALNTTIQAYCPNANEFFFWDGIHPTVAGHRIVAQRANAALGALVTH